MSAAKPIDYSKWDHIGDDSSDEEEGQEQREQRRGAPQVTKFDAPMSVTIGGGSRSSGSTDGAAAATVALAKRAATGAVAAAPPQPARSTVEDVAENGDELEAYSWRQGRQEAALTVWCPPETRAKDVAVSYDKDSRQLRVAVDGRALLEGALANPVRVDEDTGLDWELVNTAASGRRRAVRIALQKETPRPDMVHWWSRALEGDREIDTTKIQGRKHNFQQAWKEAQALFQESVRKRAEQGPVEVA